MPRYHSQMHAAEINGVSIDAHPSLANHLIDTRDPLSILLEEEDAEGAAAEFKRYAKAIVKRFISNNRT